MNFAASYNNNGWNTASQVEQSVNFYRTFRLAKPGPREKRKTQIDDRRIECVGRVPEFDAKIVADVKRSCNPNQDLSKVPVDAPIANLIRVRQGVPRDATAMPMW